MKKSFLLLPVAIAVLSACSSSSSQAPIENADNSLSPGIMQPVDNSSAGGSWEPQVQQSAMPADMSGSVATPAAATTAAPAATTPAAAAVTTPAAATVTTPAATATSASGLPQQQAPAMKTVCKQVQVKKPTANGAGSSQSVEIPRNATTNAPDYSKIDKGFYKANTYTVRKGDTMFLIAYISGMDVKELAALNGMKEPYTLSVGQVLKVSNGQTAAAASQIVTEERCEQVPVTPSVTYTDAPNGTQYGSDGTVTGPIKAGAGSAAQAGTVSGPITAGVGTTTTAAAATTGGVVAGAGSTAYGAATAPVSNITWKWPTVGKVVQGFSNIDGGNKGIDISGSKGQPVYAAAAGRVVYAGNALRGYGNLIIIKHDDDFLSAYAHNDSIKVSDQQEVKAGQQIATMGSTGTNSTKLHFEIRYKGKSVDPTRYLPRR